MKKEKWKPLANDDGGQYAIYNKKTGEVKIIYKNKQQKIEKKIGFNQEDK